MVETAYFEINKNEIIGTKYIVDNVRVTAAMVTVQTAYGKFN